VGIIFGDDITWNSVENAVDRFSEEKDINIQKNKEKKLLDTS
jgi:hypothetical protein